MEIFKLFGSIFVDNSKANESISKTDDKAQSLTGKLGGAIGTLGKWGLGIASAVGAGAVAVGKMAMDFDQSFAKVTTLLDSSTTDFDKYKKEIMQASKDSGVSVDEFSEAVYGSISAGQDAGDAIAFTTEAMKLAKGGFTDGAKAVDVMTTALNGYKMDASEASKVSDLLITTQNLGKTTVDELASSMGKVIPIASASNYSMEELSATYATLTKNGIATAEAGTYTKAMLGELSKAGSKTDVALKELTGQGFAQLKESGVSTTDILQMLSDSADASGKTLKDMFGSSEAGTAALVLMSEGGAEYNEILKEMASSTGATDEAVGKMSDTVKDKFDKVLNAAKVSAIELGDKLLPMFDTLLTWVLDNMPQIQAMIEKTFEVVGNVIGVTVAIIQWLIDAFGKILESSGVTSEGLSEIWNSVKDMFEEVFNNILELLQAWIGYFQRFWEEWGTTITTMLTTAWDNIKIIFDTVFKVINDLLKIFTALFNGDWEALWEGVKQLAKDIWDGIKDLCSNTLDGIIQLLKDIVPKMLQAGKDMFNGLWEGIKDVWDNITGWIGEKTSWLVDKLTFWDNGKKKMASDDIDGSHRNGLSYVPFDGYRAELHQGERVLTEEENEEYGNKSRSNQGGIDNSKLDAMIGKLDQVIQAIQEQPRTTQRLNRMGVI